MGAYGNQDGQRGASHGRKLVVLDRDGVINHDSSAFIKSPDEWHPIPGSLEAIARLNRAGYRVVIATNQSGIGRGLFDTAMLNDIHEKMHRAAAAAGARIEAVFFCPHTNLDACVCRKPLPGMLQEIIERYDVNDPAKVPMVGDALRDLQSGAAAGFMPHLVKTGKGGKTLADAETKGDAYALPPGTRIHDDLRQFALDFLAHHVD
jgi:D-glycero-D-manno-heptose 1,7-bisphosphate phosphatase